MSVSIFVPFASSLVGGGIVALITQLSTRDRTRAEAKKLHAEADFTQARTTIMLSKMVTPPSASEALNDTDNAPPGWRLRGSNPECYQVGVDATVAHSGTKSGFISSRPDPKGFGTIMQVFKADNYQDKRLRLSAFVKADDVKEWAGLWMRIDGDHGEMLGFDNMEDRPIKGTADWEKVKIVLDVPRFAYEIAFGLLLRGSGQVWLDYIEFETVSKDIDVTEKQIMTPINLDFEASGASAQG